MAGILPSARPNFQGCAAAGPIDRRGERHRTVRDALNGHDKLFPQRHRSFLLVRERQHPRAPTLSPRTGRLPGPPVRLPGGSRGRSPPARRVQVPHGRALGARRQNVMRAPKRAAGLAPRNRRSTSGLATISPPMGILSHRSRGLGSNFPMPTPTPTPTAPPTMAPKMGAPSSSHSEPNRGMHEGRKNDPATAPATPPNTPNTRALFSVDGSPALRSSPMISMRRNDPPRLKVIWSSSISTT